MRGIRRVILAQDISRRDAQTIGAAVQLAARLGAQVLGLFLEDPNLLRWAELPNARQVSPFSPLNNTLDRERLEAQLRSLSAQTQAELEAAAQRLGVPCSFQVIRGEISQAFSSLEFIEDLWVIATRSQVMGLEVHSLSSLPLMLRQVPRSMLLLPQRSSFRQPLVVLHSASLEVEVTLDAAQSLREASTLPLTVLLIGEGAELSQALQTWQANRKVLVQPIQVGQISLEQLAQTQTLSGCDGLVLGADSPLLEGEGLERLLTLSQTPVLVVQSTQSK